MPAWLAATVQVPALTSANVLPLTVQTADVIDAKFTARPELALAANGAGAVPMVWLPGDVKVMLCASSPTATLKLCVTAAAAR